MKSKHTIIFTRVERGSLVNAAILYLVTAQMVETSTAKELFEKALSRWVNTTESGKTAWEESREDFNIGDFSMNDNNQELKLILVENGIMSAEVETFTMDDSYGYDDHLITKN